MLENPRTHTHTSRAPCSDFTHSLRKLQEFLSHIDVIVPFRKFFLIAALHKQKKPEQEQESERKGGGGMRGMEVAPRALPSASGSVKNTSSSSSRTIMPPLHPRSHSSSNNIPPVSLDRTTSNGSQKSTRSVNAETDLSREAFRRDLTLKRRQRAITAREHRFLERLLVKGDSVEIECARSVLADDGLFFGLPETNGDSQEEDVIDEGCVTFLMDGVPSPDLANGHKRESSVTGIINGNEKGDGEPIDRAEQNFLSAEDKHNLSFSQLPPPPPPPMEHRDTIMSPSPKLNGKILNHSSSSLSRVSTSNGEALNDGHRPPFNNSSPSLPRPLAYARSRSASAFSSASSASGDRSSLSQPKRLYKRSLSLGSSAGSAERRAQLETRKNSILHRSLWISHASGIALTPMGSKGSLIMRRSNSYIASVHGRASFNASRRESFISDATLNLLETAPRPDALVDDIFRANVSTLGDGPAQPNANGASLKMTLAQQLKVTFKDDDEDGEKASSSQQGRPSRLFASPRSILRPRLVRRSSSQGSTLAIRRATPIRSHSIASVISDDNTIPSLHLATPVYSDSNFSVSSSIPSIRHATPIRSASDALGSFYSVDSSTAVSGERDRITEDARERVKAAFREHRSGNSSLLSPFGNDGWDPMGEDDDEYGEGDRAGGQSRSSSLDKMPTTIKQFKDGVPAWSNPVASDPSSQKDKEDAQSYLRHPDQDAPMKPILFRKASTNVDRGEGVEVSELEPASANIDTLDNARTYGSMLSVGGDSSVAPSIGRHSQASFSANSFDESFTLGNSQAIRRLLERNEIKRSLSNEEDGTSLLIGGASIGSNNPIEMGSGHLAVYRGDLHGSIRDSWDMGSEADVPNAWDVLKDEYAVGYGAGGALPFLILGTSADDVSAQPHVLSPPLMESLQSFLPFAISEQNFLLKFSMVRDGASLHTLLQNVRGAKYTILALETLDGEVFGSFTSEAWRKNWNYYGTGESFLWKMRRTRKNPSHSIIDQAQLESELDVYHWTGRNNFVQLCTNNRIALGGSSTTGTGDLSSYDNYDDDKAPTINGTLEEDNNEDGGFGLAIEDDLLHGSTVSSATFGNPSLSSTHSKGELFEIVNLELWTLTPCMSFEEAEKLELGRLFLQTQMKNSSGMHLT